MAEYFLKERSRTYHIYDGNSDSALCNTRTPRSPVSIVTHVKPNNVCRECVRWENGETKLGLKEYQKQQAIKGIMREQ